MIRIIGGIYRGKKLTVPAVEGLRPTPDRVRETLFNWLMNDIRDSRCLDAFAGSGALGLEAFSRGAAKVIFIEQDNLAYAHLKKTLTDFKSKELTVLKTDALDYLDKCNEQFDIIFLDPPFSKNYLLSCINSISKQKLLSSGGLLYIESAQVIELDELQWQQIKLKQAGQVFYALFMKL